MDIFKNRRSRQRAHSSIHNPCFSVACTGAATTDVDKYPTKPVRLIAPFVPGAGTDITARAIALELSAALRTAVHRGQPSGRGRSDRRGSDRERGA